MGKIVNDTQRQTKENRSRKIRQIFKKGRQIGSEVIYQFGKYTVFVMLGFIVLLGLLNVYDQIFPEKIPFVNLLGRRSAEYSLASHTSQSCIDHWSKENCWADLQPALKILDKICPEVSIWVREKHKINEIVWKSELDGCRAKYDFFNKKLMIHQSFFSDNDGKKASVLAHEFRHARQNHTKWLRLLLASMIQKNPNDEIVENDAYLFEYEVYLAIFN